MKMPAAKKKASKATNAVTFTKSVGEVPSNYANNTQLTVSAYDFKFTFGQIVESTTDGVLVEPKTVVFMSPQHAKAISELLVNHIKIYEEMSGHHISDPLPST